MFYHDGRLQYKVDVENPNPHFARMLQQAIGGIEGEMRVCLQYLFQAWNSKGPRRYREMLLETGTEEIGHIEMLVTAVNLNLTDAPTQAQKHPAMHPIASAMLSGMDIRQFLSGGFGALASDANGVPFNGSWVVSSGNIAADMHANVMAEATGRVLATRLYEATEDAGMKDMLSFLIARDTMHQNQWLAVLKELEEQGDVYPIPNSFPQEKQNQEFAYKFVSTKLQGEMMAEGRWATGPSIDGKGQFVVEKIRGLGGEPHLPLPRVEAHAQTEQMDGAEQFDGARV